MIILYFLLLSKIFIVVKTTKFNGIYNINCILLDEGNMKIDNNNYLIPTDKKISYRIINIDKNIYFIESIYAKVRLGVNDKNELKFFYRSEYIFMNESKIMWEFIEIKKKYYLIKNIFNQNLIEINNNKKFQCINGVKSNNFKDYNSKNQFLFSFIKYYNEYIFDYKYSDIVKKEPIDILIKYIDLSDNSLKREGIKQIDKDKDNEELRYSIRSILKYIPWIRKIFILMPNKKVRYLKELEIIQDKIQYINDREFLGYDSANIHAFTFNLFKLKYFGSSDNIIYMEDDFFIGNNLKKSNLFFYDKSSDKVAPLLFQKYFSDLNITEELLNYKQLYKDKTQIHPHSGDGWEFSIYQTNIFFYQIFQNINPIIKTSFSHCARAENLKEVRDLFKFAQEYAHINETLFSKERHILTLNMPQFENLYQLNILKKPNNAINYKYILVENLNNENLNKPLFVINTAGNHQPSKRQFFLEKKILQKRYPFKSIYEIKTDIIKKSFIKNAYFRILKILIIFIIIKIYYF